MKKSLLALAVLGAFAGVAQAQTSVTIYGSFDGGLRNLTNVNAAGDTRLTVGSNGTYNSNRLGFKGVEDLGGGMNAHFNLETGFNTGTGNVESNTASQVSGNGFFWNRTATVGLGGAWGSVDIGRQYSLSFKTIGLYDPFNYKYTGIIPLASIASGNAAGSALGGTRFSNDIQYNGSFGPVNVGAEWSLGEVAGATRANSAQAVSASYVNGPLAIGGVYTVKKPAAALAGGVSSFPGATPVAIGAAAATAATPTFDDKAFTVGASYKFGAFRVAGGYNDEKLSGAATPTVLAGAAGTTVVTAAAGDTRLKVGWLGLGFDVSPVLNVTGAWYQSKLTVPTTAAAVGTDGKRDLFILGGTYALSKRTNFYADVDYTKLRDNQVIGFGGAATQDRQTGISVGVNHLF
jgi:predicted porin